MFVASLHTAQPPPCVQEEGRQQCRLHGGPPACLFFYFKFVNRCFFPPCVLFTAPFTKPANNESGLTPAHGSESQLGQDKQKQMSLLTVVTIIK